MNLCQRREESAIKDQQVVPQSKSLVSKYVRLPDEGWTGLAASVA